MKYRVQKKYAAFVKNALLVVMVSFAVFSIFSQPLQAQSSTQVNIVGIPPVISSPYADDIESKFKSGQYQVIFNYSNFNSQPVDFVFDVALIRNNRTLFEITSMPRAYTPGSYVFTSFFEEVQFRETSDDILSQLNRDLKNQVIQSGSMPEGNYSLEIQARPFTGESGINAIQGLSVFSVRYPQPPILISIQDNANVNIESPTFSWTPVVSSMGGMFEYDFLLVEVFNRQSPLQAINSNREHAAVTLAGQTTLPYTLQYLPLEEGMTYAWQVTARNSSGQMPLQNEGVSEIYTFTYRDKSGSDDFADGLSTFPLIQNLVDLTGFDRAEVLETRSSYIINGTVEALLEVPESISPVLVRAQAINLEVQKGNLSNPVFLGGRVEFEGDPFNEIYTDLQFVQFDEVTWDLNSGLTANVSLITPDQQTFKAEGDLQLTSAGISGIVRARGSPLFQFDGGPVDFEIQQLVGRFPENRLTAEGDIRMDGVDAPCTIEGMDFTGNITTTFNCTNFEKEPFLSETSVVSLTPSFVLGDLTLNLESSDMEYSISMQSDLEIDLTEERTCKIKFQTLFDSEEGTESKSIQQNCSILDGGIDLGFADLALQNIELHSIGFDTDKNEWDFDVEFDTRLNVNGFDGWKSPWFENTRLTPDGIHFEEQTFVRNSPQLPEFDMEGYTYRLEEFVLNQFTFPLFDWDGEGPGPWEIVFSGNIKTPTVAGMPSCLKGTWGSIENGRISGNDVVSDIQLDVPGGCRWEFGAGYAIEMSGFSGTAGLTWKTTGGTPDIEPFADIQVNGSMESGLPHKCNEKTAAENISFTLNGGINGRFENLFTGCPVEVGPFTAHFKSSEIELNWTQGSGQQAVMAAEVILDLPNDVKAEGPVSFDLMTGQLIDAEINIDEPFIWNIPEENPVLSFNISRANLSSDGLFIDGRQELILGEKTIRATFDQLLVDASSLDVKSGRIIFDEMFAFEAGITNGRDLSFNAIPAGSGSDLKPGLYMEMGSVVIVDSTGIQTKGDGKASILLGEQKLGDDLTITYSDDFRMGFEPFGVRRGKAEFSWKKDLFATIDRDGFHPEIMFFADRVLPNRLPLPTEEVAYIQLRENDELLVDYEELEDGDFALNTIPGKLLSLVIPAFNESDPPTVADVQLNDLVISGNPMNPEILSGGIIANVDLGNQMGDLTENDIPLQVTRIQFGETDLDGYEQVNSLLLEGKLNLFESVITDMPDVVFSIQGDGEIEASLFADQFEAGIEMIPGSDRVLYQLNSFSGSFTGNLLSAQMPSFQFDLFGQFLVRDEDETVANADLDLALTEDTFNIQNFDGEFGDLPGLDLGFFEFNFKEIERIPEFSYSKEEGFQFAIVLDADLQLNLNNGESVTFPISDIEIGNHGFTLPKLNVHSGSPAGLTLPSISLSGFEFKPLALRTNSTLNFNWYSPNWSFDPDLALDFALYLPEFSGSDMLPPDGITFSNVAFSEGDLTGSIQAHIPLGDAEIPIVPGLQNSPILQVNSIGGSLSREETDGEFEQEVDLFIDANLKNLPHFSQPDQESCDNLSELTLSIVDGAGFDGSLTGYSPCGNVQLGPVELEALQTDLYFNYTNGVQSAYVDGDLQVTLPATDDGETVVTGRAELDLITGNFRDGSISIYDPFQLHLGPDQDNPVFTLGLQQARIDSSGITLNGSGDVVNDNYTSAFTLDALKLDLPSLQVVSGSATFDSGLAFEVSLNPISIRNVVPGSTITGDNIFRFVAESETEISRNGLTFTGSGSAELIHGGQSFANLNALFEDDFSINIDQFLPKVTTGRAEFRLDEDAAPLLTWDSNGIRLGGGLVALLPDRIGLPVESIAYVDLVDEEGEPLLQIDPLDEGGYTISTGEDPLPIVIPALSEGDDTPPVIASTFTFTTDDQYNITDGSIEVSEELNLEPIINLPLSITGLDFGDSDAGIRLQASVLARLPSIFQGHAATGLFEFEQGAGFSGTIEVGSFSDEWTPELMESSPVYSFTPPLTQLGEFSADLYGIQIEVGSTNSLKFASSISSNVLAAESGHTLFFAASYLDGEWNGNANYKWPSEVIDMGLAEFIPDEQDALTIDFSNDQFIAGFNGTVSFEKLLDDDFAVAVHGLQLGVIGIQESPELHFDLGEAASELPDQEFNLLQGTLAGGFTSPQITIDGTTLNLKSSDGSLSFLDETLAYEELHVSTAGEFSISNIGTDNFTLFGEYVTLEGLAVNYEEMELSVGANFTVTLPDPVSQTAGASVYINRADDGTLNIESEGPDFDFEGTYDLGSIAEFHLHDAEVKLDIANPEESTLMANGAVFFDDREVITFGNPGNSFSESGISYQPSRRNAPLRFNATGNASFSFEHSFFEIDISANGVANSMQSEFMVVLNGQAGLTLPGVSGKIGYEGFTINSSGVEDIGNYSGTGELSLMNFAKLGLGKFHHSSEPTNITIKSSSTEDPSELEGSDHSEETIMVNQLLCFGTFEGIEQCEDGGDALHLSLGGESNSASGGIEGNIEGILFYETTDGDRLFYMNGFNVQISEVFAMSATIQYESTVATEAGAEEGMLLRVAASGSVNLAGSAGVNAVVAGKFENRGGLSFGLFAAVEANLGVPIVPGIIELTGLGGGFFYRPSDEDLSFVHGVIDNETEHKIQFADPGGGGEQGEELKFAAMFYTQLGIAGSGGMSVVDASTYIEVTNQSFYFDAYGVVMGMGGAASGAPAGMELTASIYLKMQYQTSESTDFTEFLLEGNLTLNADVPAILNGKGELDFFAGRSEATGFLWGIEGYADVDIYGDILNGNMLFLASDIGFLIEGGLGVSMDLKVISFNTDLLASIWYIDHPDFTIPFGGYASATIEICVVLCKDATAKGAFAHRGGDQFNLYAYGQIGKLSGYLSVISPGSGGSPDIESGRGKGDEADLIAQAQSQQELFSEYIDDLKSDLEEALENMDDLSAPQLTIASTEDAELAGYNLLNMNQSQRDQWATIIRDNENSSSIGIPQSLDVFLYFFVDLEVGSYNKISNSMLTWTKNFTNFYKANTQLVYDEILTELNRIMEETSAIEEAAETAYDDFLSVMEENPVSNIQRVDKGNYGRQAPVFQVDPSLAESQAQQVENAADQLELMGMAMLEPIRKVESMIRDLETVLHDQPTETLELGEPAEGVGNLIVDISPSILGFAELYSRTLNYTERYYTYLANEQWINRSYALSRRNPFSGSSNAFSTAITSLTDRLDTQTEQNYEKERLTTANRSNILFHLRNGTRPNNYSPLPEAGATNQATTQYNELASYDENMYTQVHTSNQRFWNDMFDLGTLKMIESTEENLNEILSDREEKVANLKSSLRDFTSSIEDFYDMKANTTSILYAMVDNYVSVVGEFEDNLSDENKDDFNHYTNRRDEIATMLQPPDISGINVTPHRPFGNFYNETNITWSATHPQGVQESAIQIESGESQGIYQGLDSYLSIGSKSDYTLFASKTSGVSEQSNRSEDNTHNYSVGVRVRGPAGTVATRRGQFSIAVGSGGESVDPGTNILPDEIEPPQITEVRHSRDFEYYSGAFWTNNPQLIRISARSRDQVSGIEKFEYAIGSSRGATDVVDWTLLSGAMEYSENGIVTISADSRVIDLELDSSYFVSVRATNGAGLVSAVNSSTVPVRFDPDPPSDIEIDQTYSQRALIAQVQGVSYIPMLPGSSSMFAYEPLSSSPPEFESFMTTSLLNTMKESSNKPTIAVSWTESEDSRSGVSHYEYVVNSTPDVFEDQFAAEGKSIYNYDSPLLIEGGAGSDYSDLLNDYHTSVYVHVRAVNHAGLTSNTITFERVAPDPSAPSAPVMRVRENGSGYELLLYLTMPAYDAESGLKGIQYALGTSMGATDLRSFPSGDEVDMDIGNEHFEDVFTAFQPGFNPGNMDLSFLIPHHSISALYLPYDQEIYVSFRSVNNQGGKSKIRRTGPVIRTQPPDYVTIEYFQFSK